MRTTCNYQDMRNIWVTLIITDWLVSMIRPIQTMLQSDYDQDMTACDLMQLSKTNCKTIDLWRIPTALKLHSEQSALWLLTVFPALVVVDHVSLMIPKWAGLVAIYMCGIVEGCLWPFCNCKTPKTRWGGGGGGGHSGTERAAPALRISRKKGSFLKPPHVRDFVKEGYFFVPWYEVCGSKYPYNPRNIRGSDAEWLPKWLGFRVCCRHLLPLNTQRIKIRVPVHPMSVFL